jgi:hypothetical protein
MLGFLDRWWWAVLSARLSGCSRSVPFCICFRDILQRQIPFTTTYVLAPSLAHLLTCFLGAVWKPLVWKHVKVFSFRMWLWCCVLNFQNSSFGLVLVLRRGCWRPLSHGPVMVPLGLNLFILSRAAK